MKQEDPEEVIAAIRDVLSGHTYVSEEVLSAGVRPSSRSEEGNQPLDELTDSQLEVLEWLGMGKDRNEIARFLKATPKAVEREIKEMRSKLNLKTDNELIRYAVCWVEGGDS
jgi:DNA-binding NarL/FixJ family response regulator